MTPDPAELNTAEHQARPSDDVVHGAAGPEPSQESRPRGFPEMTPTRERQRLNRIQAFAATIIAIGVVLTLCYFAELVLVVVLVSILLSFILAPIVELLYRLKIPHGVGAAISVLLLLAALYGITYVSYNQAINFVHEFPKYSGEIRKELMRFRERAEEIQKTTEGVMPESGEEKGVMKVRATTSWSEQLTHGFASLTETVLIISFTPFLVYFMLTWEQHVRSATVMLFRLENRNTAYVTLGLIAAMIRSFILGNVLVGLFISAASVAVFGFLHLPYFYFLGVISGFLSLVPYLGVVLALAPPLIAGIGQINYGDVIAVVVTVFGLHLFALNVLYPKFLGSRLQLNPLAVTLGLLFWGFIWGAMGLVLAIPILAAMKIVFDHVESLRPFGAWLGE
ncbi:MAG TPA: AI-2E family transporter [Terriglobia bacterium]|nr:AI-2E family transporter [Terriglobia bacterium]